MTLRRLTIGITYLCLGILLSSCAKGRLIVERSPDSLRVAPQKVISITPDYSWFSPLKEEDLVLRSEQRRDKFQEQLVKSAAAAGIELDIYSPSTLRANDVTYFNDLLPLRRYIFQVNRMQDIDISRRGSRGGISLGTFDEPMVLPAEFSQLAETFGTPYFSVQGIITYKRRKAYRLRRFPESVFYQVIVDVVEGKVVYRELRRVDKPPTNGNLAIMIYDSFRIFQKG